MKDVWFVCLAWRKQAFLAVLASLSLAVGARAQSLPDYTDASGRVHLRITIGAWSGYSSAPTATVQVAPGYVLVGGGAEIDGQGNPGALLTASYPDPYLSVWTAKSKDHMHAWSHRIRAYAVGMRVDGLSDRIDANGQPLILSYVRLFGPVQSASAQHPSVTGVIGVPGQNWSIIGGGASTIYRGAGVMLTGSYPPNPWQWTAEAKDHEVADSGWVLSYPIGVRTDAIPNVGHLATSYSTNDGMSYGGAFNISTATPYGYATTCVGAQTQWNGYGRMLEALFYAPYSFPPSGSTWSQDHDYQDSGSTSVYTLGVQLFP
jgi:hypothetical protein